MLTLALESMKECCANCSGVTDQVKILIGGNPVNNFCDILEQIPPIIPMKESPTVKPGCRLNTHDPWWPHQRKTEAS